MNIKFDKTLKILDFDYSNNGNIRNFSYDLNLKKNDLLKEDIKKINIKDLKNKLQNKFKKKIIQLSQKANIV